MKRNHVESHAVQSIGYEPASCTLEVEFEGGALYDYLNVPEALYRQFLQSDSKGRFFSKQIRDRFEYRKTKSPA